MSASSRSPPVLAASGRLQLNLGLLGDFQGVLHLNAQVRMNALAVEAELARAWAQLAYLLPDSSPR